MKEIKTLHDTIENTENGFRKKLREKNEKIKVLNKKLESLEKNFKETMHAKHQEIDRLMRDFAKNEDDLKFQMVQMEIHTQDLEIQLNHVSAMVQ